MSTPTRELFTHDAWQTTRNARMFRVLVAARNGEIAKRLRWLRQQKSVTQPEAAQSVGARLRTLQLWEAGSTLPESKTLRRIAAFYGTTTQWILHGDDGDAPPTRFALLEKEVQELRERIERLELLQGLGDDATPPSDDERFEPPASLLQDDEVARPRAKRRRRAG